MTEVAVTAGLGNNGRGTYYSQLVDIADPFPYVSDL